MAEMECPRCHTRTDFAVLGRDVDSFCPVCDYPMFYAGDKVVRQAAVFASASTAFTRRYPGVRGIASIDERDCGNCSERNDATAKRCWRCNSELLDPPADEPKPEPKPEPEPEPDYEDEFEDGDPTEHRALLIAFGLTIALLVLLLLVLAVTG